MRERSQADRIVLTQLHGAAWHRACWHEPTEAETAAAVAELREIVGGRVDGGQLLAEVAGLMAGTTRGRLMSRGRGRRRIS